MRVRKFIAKMHLWLALTAGLLFLLSSLSGALLVFGHELDGALNPHLFRATPGPGIGFDRACGLAGAAFPGRPVQGIAAPAMPRTHGVYEVRLARTPPASVYVDPGAGQILGVREPGSSAVGWLTALHVSLTGGEAGRGLAGAAGVCLLLALLTGCYLWWPGWKKIARGFKVRTRQGRVRATFDLHRVLGAVTAPLLGLIVLSGVLLTFDVCAGYFLNACFLRRPAQVFPERGALKSRPGAAGRLSLDELSARAEAAVPGACTTYMLLPRKSDDVVMVRLRRPDSVLPNGRCHVYLDQYRGEVLWRVDERDLAPPDSLRLSWLYPLHTGVYGGVCVRALHLLAGLVPLALFVTGLLIWRHRARRAHASLRPATSAAARREA